MEQLYACPFCRQLFTQGEVDECPECNIPLRPLADLPPSLEAQAIDPEPAVAPEDELVSWTYLGRLRGPLMLLALSGIGVFFAPWLHQRAPEILDLSGFRFATILPWLWAAGVAWPFMLVLVASRRTIRQMRGSRVAVMFLAAMVVGTVAMRLIVQPSQPHKWVALRFSYGWGLYMAGLLGVAALIAGFFFGGPVNDMPTKQEREGDETLH